MPSKSLLILESDRADSLIASSIANVVGIEFAHQFDSVDSAQMFHTVQRNEIETASYLSEIVRLGCSPPQSPSHGTVIKHEASTDPRVEANSART
jgi:hypothetical protein